MRVEYSEVEVGGRTRRHWLRLRGAAGRSMSGGVAARLRCPRNGAELERANGGNFEKSRPNLRLLSIVLFFLIILSLANTQRGWFVQC